MLIVTAQQIRNRLDFGAIIARMRDAVVAQSRGQCQIPMPMHLDIPAQSAEVHIKSAYRAGGKYFVVKVAGSYPENTKRGLSAGMGMMVLCSAETGEPLVFFADGGFLTDVRTAAATAMVTRELKREDRVLGILGSGIQARLTAKLHVEILDIEKIHLWGRTPEHAVACARDIEHESRRVRVQVERTPAAVAQHARLIVTCTAAREPLLRLSDLQPGTHVSAVGADAPGKQELSPEILSAAPLLLVDSRQQCVRLGELQHALSERDRAIEIGKYCVSPVRFDPKRDGPRGITVCDFTGLGVEDLYIAEYVHADRNL